MMSCRQADYPRLQAAYRAQKQRAAEAEAATQAVAVPSHQQQERQLDLPAPRPLTADPAQFLRLQVCAATQINFDEWDTRADVLCWSNCRTQPCARVQGLKKMVERPKTRWL